MKRLLFSLIFFLTIFTNQSFAQTDMPNFLQGTWKVENREVYEAWETLEDGSLNGTSYRLVNGEKVISEYIKIRKMGNQIIYTAIVPAQNQGRGIEFVLHQPDSRTFSFENPEHDFPKKIVYQKKSDSEIYVAVSDGGDQGFAYTMKKSN